VATRLCPVCGIPIPDDSAFCPACGSRIPPRWRYRFAGTYPFPRFQVDPSEPQPRRDIRWPILVLGFSFLMVSGFLLLVYFIVGAATSGSGLACGGGSPCQSVIFEYVFLVPALVLLAVGVILIVVVFYDIR
jgi:hypothetical protein